MKRKRILAGCFILVLFLFTLSPSQDRGARPTPADRPDKADIAMVNRIWEEGINRSRLRESLSYLTDVIGPRIPGSPAMGKAYDWAVAQFKERGLENVAVEPSGEFGPGWQNEYCSVHLTAPAYQPVLAYAVPWTLGTKGKITGQPVMAIIGSKADMEKYKGKLKGAIVFTQPPQQAHPSFDPRRDAVPTPTSRS